MNIVPTVLRQIGGEVDTDRPSTFRSLRSYNFRLYFGGQLISMAGTFMQTVAQSWLVLSLTKSGSALGLVTTLQFLPALCFAGLAGVLVDRVDHRRLAMCTQALGGLEALVLGLLVVTGNVQVWMVYAMAATLGLITTVDQPLRATFVYDMVGPHDLTNAVSLNMALNNTSRIIGPGLAGVIIAVFGVGPCFLINAASFVAVLIALALMRPHELHPVPIQPRKPRQFRDGLAYVRRSPQLLAILVLAAVYAGLAWEFDVTLPLLAKYTFHGGAGLYGIMTAIMGVGAVIGALGTARRAQPTNRLVLGSAVTSGVALLGTALAPNAAIGLIGIIALGITGTVFASSASALLQLRAAGDMRGRVMGLWSVALLGTRPIGGPLTGWVGQVLGARYALGLAAVVVLAVTVPVGLLLVRTAD